MSVSKNTKITCISLGLCLVALQFYDVWLTLTMIETSKDEVNPIASFFIDYYGTLKGLIYLKLLVIYTIIALVLYGKNSIFVRNTLLFAVCFYIFILGGITFLCSDVLF